MATGRVYRIKKSAVKGYGYSSPPKKRGLKRNGPRFAANGSVTHIAAINGRGAYRSARRTMSSLSANRRPAAARSSLSAAKKAAFARKMRSLKQNGGFVRIVAVLRQTNAFIRGCWPVSRLARGMRRRQKSGISGPKSERS